jgi:catechol 2,3-dioxygenase-like lactoylglutathione lyase family enzyme
MPAGPEPAVEIMGLMHGGITVSDMEASLAFYRDGLGLPVATDTVRVANYTHQALALPFTDIRLVLLAIPGTPDGFIELLEYRGAERLPAASRPCDPASGHLCLQVRDLAAAHARLTGLGYRSRSNAVVEVDAGPNTGGRIVYLADPDGYWIELVERARPA